VLNLRGRLKNRERPGHSGQLRCANACTKGRNSDGESFLAGPSLLEDRPSEVLLASTGVIWKTPSLEVMEKGLPALAASLSSQGLADAALAS